MRRAGAVLRGPLSKRARLLGCCSTRLCHCSDCPPFSWPLQAIAQATCCPTGEWRVLWGGAIASQAGQKVQVLVLLHILVPTSRHMPPAATAIATAASSAFEEKIAQACASGGWVGWRVGGLVGRSV